MIDRTPQTNDTRLIYHLVPAGYYRRQPAERPYLPETFNQEGFIHCTSGVELLVEVANTFFANLPDDLFVLEIDPTRLTAPLKYEPPLPPVVTTSTPDVTASPQFDQLFPHIYGPLNRRAIKRQFALQRAENGTWQLPITISAESG